MERLTLVNLEGPPPKSLLGEMGGATDADFPYSRPIKSQTIKNHIFGHKTSPQSQNLEFSHFFGTPKSVGGGDNYPSPTVTPMARDIAPVKKLSQSDDSRL